MNSLSWLIYLSSFVGVVQGLFILLTVACGVWSVACILLAAFGHPERCSKDEGAKAYGKKYVKFSIPFLMFFWLAAAAVPDQRTVLLIAGSEIGGSVYSDPGTQELLKEAKEVLKSKLKKLKD